MLNATPDEDDEDETGAIMMTLFENLTRKISMLEKTARLRKAKNDDDDDDDAAATSDDKEIQSLLERLGDLVRPRKEATDDVPMSAYSRPRFLYRLVTLWYAVTWCTVFGLWHATGREPETWVMVEFLSTPLAESATLAELLQTLPSTDSGAAAVRHYWAYKVVFAIGTCVNYSVFVPHLPYAVLYPVVHCCQALVIGLLRLRARGRLYEKFAYSRHEKGFGYLSALGRVLTAQALLIMATVANFLKERNANADANGSSSSGEGAADEGNSFLVELFAATTLSMAVAQGFELTVYMRDASALTLHRLSMFDFSKRERAAFAAVVVFFTVNVLLYMLSEALTLEQAQYFYWTSLGTYWLAICVVGYVVVESERDRRTLEDGPPGSPSFSGRGINRRLPGALAAPDKSNSSEMFVGAESEL